MKVKLVVAGLVVFAVVGVQGGTRSLCREAAAFQAKLLEIGKGKSFVYAWSTSSGNWTADGLKGFREKTGTDPLLYFVELNRSFGTWPEPKSAECNRARLAATIRLEWERRRAVPMATWHIENPYAPPAWTDPKYGRTPMRYRYASKDYPQQHRYLAREIVKGTGEPCGEGRIDGTKGPAFANPRAWYLAQLDDLASFCAALCDSDGRAIPIVLRLFHECEDDWQWWGSGSATPADYIALFRLSVERLREKNPVDNMLFCYSPNRYWKTLGEPQQDGFLTRYPGDDYVEMIGFDDYGLGKGDRTKTTAETVRKMRLVSEFGAAHGKICGLCETGVKGSCDAFYTELHRAMTSPGVSFAFAATYDGPWTFPETAAGKQDMAAFFDRAEVVSGKNAEAWK